MKNWQINDFDTALTSLVRGVNLIEASAGTGKTYAIAMLVLRLITEYSLKIEEILLVTFTRAATEELADRIRKRLVEARVLLEGEEISADPTLRDWAEGVKRKREQGEKIHRALLDIDRAAIFTIHGFCQRILQEQALESGQLFDVELKPDVSSMRRTAAFDYWRKNIYTMPGRQCGAVLDTFSSPEALYRSVSLFPDSLSRIEPQVAPLAELGGAFELACEKMSIWWQTYSPEVYQRLQQSIANGEMKKGFSQGFQQWWKSLDDYFRKQTIFLPPNLQWLSNEGFSEQINGSKIRGERREKLIVGTGLPDSDLTQMLHSRDELLLCVRVHCATFLKQESERLMTHNNQISYDDLIIQLYQAITTKGSDPLKALLKKQYKAALIDEFQDTDQYQWRIFKHLFGGGNHFLYLIGDPKQAIYRFRGADIHSYFQAKKAATSSFTLKKNYRSHPSVVLGINGVFSRRVDPFCYDKETLGFSPVTAALSAKGSFLEKDGENISGLVYCQLPENPGSKDGSWGLGDGATIIRDFITEEIVDLLRGHARICEGQKRRVLRPDDIAVLVRSNNHAEEYRQRLEEAGVPAVVSSKRSVFQSDESHEMVYLLEALARPENLEILKRGMAVSWLGYSGNDLHSLWNDDREFDGVCSRFSSYSEKWQSRGILVMMNSFLKEEGVFVNLSRSRGVERKIANISHLLELLQQAESENAYGPLQLIHYLRHQIEEKSNEDELRLEKDDEAVKIVTMHGAKGLEYPVVFCPYLWYRQNRMASEKWCVGSFESGGRVIDLGSIDFDKRRSRAEREEIAEDIRLMYVAMTRAKQRCYVIWSDVKGKKRGPADSFDSSLGYLLFPDGRVNHDQQRSILQEFAINNNGQHRDIKIEKQPKSHCRKKQTKEKLSVRRLEGARVYTDWQMTSYSSLVSSDDHWQVAERGEDKLKSDYIPLKFATLPSGANFGNLIHDLLEKNSFAALQSAAKLGRHLQEECQKHGVAADMELLIELLEAVVSTPLLPLAGEDVSSIRLADLNGDRCIKEMGFYYRLHRSNTSSFNRTLENEETVNAVNEKELEGYLTGFIDLVFEHGGRFYITDYKTNNLGEHPSCYEHAGLIQTMSLHNYGLQYWIYSLVLHRHLQNVYPGYEFTTHFGGVLYLFVRGLDETGRGVYFHRPDLRLLERLSQYFREGK